MAENRAEYMRMKKSSIKFIDGVNADSDIGRQVIELVYGFTRRGFLEYRKDKELNTGTADVQ